MKLTVYVDLLILVNTIINYYLIQLTSSIRGKTIPAYKMLFSAFAGAFFSLHIFRQNDNLLFGIAYKGSSLLLMVLLAFRFKNKAQYIRDVMVFTLINCLFTGILMLFFADVSFVYINNFFCYINVNPVLFVLCISFFYIVLCVAEYFMDFKPPELKYKFELFSGNKKVYITAFYDTGFRVRDIVTKKAVMMCRLSRIQDILTDETTCAIKNYNENMVNCSALIPVFYSDVSGKGVLPAIKPEKILYKNKELKNIIIAVVSEEIISDADAIFGKDIFIMTGE